MQNLVIEDYEGIEDAQDFAHLVEEFGSRVGDHFGGTDEGIS